MTDLEIEELRQLLAEASMRPWFTEPSVSDETALCVCYGDQGDRYATYLVAEFESLAGDDCNADARLVAAAVNALPALIAEVRELREKAETGALLAEVERLYDPVHFALDVMRDADGSYHLRVFDRASLKRVAQGTGPTLTAALRDLLGVDGG